MYETHCLPTNGHATPMILHRRGYGVLSEETRSGRLKENTRYLKTKRRVHVVPPCLSERGVLLLC